MQLIHCTYVDLGHVLSSYRNARVGSGHESSFRKNPAADPDLHTSTICTAQDKRSFGSKILTPLNLVANTVEDLSRARISTHVY